MRTLFLLHDTFNAVPYNTQTHSLGYLKIGKINNSGALHSYVAQFETLYDTFSVFIKSLLLLFLLLLLLLLFTHQKKNLQFQYYLFRNKFHPKTKQQNNSNINKKKL